MKCARVEWRVALRRGMLAATLAAAAGGAAATENGGSIYPMGAENYMTGALPPPGLYGMVFLNRYEADELRDNNGNRVPLDFSVRANAISPRLVWVPGVNVLGGDLVLHTILPLVNLRVQAGGASQTKTGIGDAVFGTGLGYHYGQHLHAVYGVDVFAPTGQYNKNDLANIGRNYWAVQPLANLSYVDPAGLNADIKAMYTYNFKNPATDYKSGQEFHFDYAVGWGVGGGWVLGAGGYAYWQVSDDKVNAQTVPDNKGRAFALGPSLKYDSGKGWFVTAKWQKEMGVRNRAQGNAFWVKAVFPL